MRIPESKVDEIYNALDIVEVVSDYLPLKKRGGNWWALSPFTTEKTPSFAVSPAKGIYKCFSTGKGGNAINFLMEMEGYTYPEALRVLAKKYGVDIPEEEETSEEKENRDQRQSLFIVNEFAARWFHQQLKDTEEGRNIGLSYFRERGILQATIDSFQLGYAPDSWEAFTQAATTQQYKEEYLKELGLVSTSEKSGKLFDRFRGRVMFPITDQVGKVVGFGGRVLSSEKQMAKYINSSESVIYHKSRVLYGLDQAKQQLRNEDLCILTEGYMDTIVLHQSGIRNVVASSGTALTPEQVRLIRRFTKNILMIYDGDAAGVKAALRGIDLLVQEGMNAKVLILPDEHDPDSYIQAYGAEKFRAYADKESLSFLDFKLLVLRKSSDPNDPSQEAALVREIAATLARIPDLIQRQLYLKHAAEKLGIEESLMIQAASDARRQQARFEQRESRRQMHLPGEAAPPPAEAEVKALKSFETLDLARQEMELLRILVNHHDKHLNKKDWGEEAEDQPLIEGEEVSLVTFFIRELQNLEFENTIFERLKQEIFSATLEKRTFNVHHYLNHEDPAICNLVSDLLSVEHSPSENWRKRGVNVPPLDHDLSHSVRSALYHYQRKKVGKLLQELREKMREMTHEQENEYFQMLVYLNNMRAEVTRKLGIIVEG